MLRPLKVVVVEQPDPSLNLVVLRVPDLEASKSFFESLGLLLLAEKHGSGPAHWSCTLGDVVVELYPGGEASPSPQRLGFRVPNLEAVLQAIRVGQGSVVNHDPARRVAVVRAPDGTKVELSEIR